MTKDPTEPLSGDLPVAKDPTEPLSGDLPVAKDPTEPLSGDLPVANDPTEPLSVNGSAAGHFTGPTADGLLRSAQEGPGALRFCDVAKVLGGRRGQILQAIADEDGCKLHR